VTAGAVTELLRFLEEQGLEIHVDGGWAVDALLGEQTRPHDDLDIAIPHSQVPALRAVLETRGFRDYARKDSWECNFVLADHHDNRLDVHAYKPDGAGVPYPAESLTGKGTIDGQPVRCIDPEWLVKFHTGYEPDDNDRHDAQRLCNRFNIAPPSEYCEELRR